MNYIGTQVEDSKAPKGAAAGEDSQSMDITAAHSRAWWIVRASVLAAGLALVGCAGEVDGADAAGISPVLSAAAPRIFGGETDAPEDASGVVALRVGSGTSFELCTGALIASNVVVTARHCVTKNYGTKVSCDAQGRSTNGKHVAGDEELSNIAIYTGSQPRFASKPAALARAIVAPSSYYLCDSDIAVVVLDRDVPGKPFSVRLHAPATARTTRSSRSARASTRPGCPCSRWARASRRAAPRSVPTSSRSGRASARATRAARPSAKRPAR